MTDEDWNELDNAAKANLEDSDFKRFLSYKEQLKKDGHAWDNDAYEILTGYIWDESEELDDPDQ